MLVDIDRDTAARLGITAASIDDALYSAFGQRIVSTIFTETNQYRVMLEARPEQASRPQALGQHASCAPLGRRDAAVGGGAHHERARRCRSRTWRSTRPRPSASIRPGRGAGPRGRRDPQRRRT
jgi:hypothetical protein